MLGVLQLLHHRRMALVPRGGNSRTGGYGFSGSRTRRAANPTAQDPHSRSGDVVLSYVCERVAYQATGPWLGVGFGPCQFRKMGEFPPAGGKMQGTGPVAPWATELLSSVGVTLRDLGLCLPVDNGSQCQPHFPEGQGFRGLSAG